MKIRHLAAALGALTLTACGPTTSTTTSSGAGASGSALAAAQSSAAAAASSAEAAASSSEAAASSSAEAAKNAPAPFGGTKTFEDGVAISVEAPTAYTPSDTAAGASPGQAAFKVRITVTNGSSKNFDPSQVQVSAQAGGTEGSAIFDSAKNIGGTPTTLVPPGKSVTFPAAFAVPSMSDVIVQVTPGSDYAPALFEG